MSQTKLPPQQNSSQETNKKKTEEEETTMRMRTSTAQPDRPDKLECKTIRKKSTKDHNADARR
jgi:hypothetical protein